MPVALNHPLVQSLVLPLLLSLAGITLLRPVAGPARASAAVGVAVLLSTVWMMGWTARPDSTIQKLPWIFAGALLTGVALDVLVSSRRLRWFLLTAAWLAVSWWLGTRGFIQATAFALAGAAVIAFLVRAPDDRADAAAATIGASLGLAAVTFFAGSLLLLQLSLLLAAAVGGAGLWLWPGPRIRFGAAAVAVAGLAWLALAQATLLLTPARIEALVLLAVAFAAPSLVARRWPGNRPAAAAPLAAALLAGLMAAAALALQLGGSGTGEGAKDGTGMEDPYYRN